MSKKSKPNTQNPEKEKKPLGRPQVKIKPETKRGIWAVVLFALALLTLLSIFQFAGSVGEVWRKLLGILFGLGTLIMPLVLIIAGIFVVRGQRFEHIKTRASGLVITVVGLLALFHIWTDSKEMVQAAIDGQGGGWLGLLLAYPLRAGLGFWGALIVLIALVVIGVLLVLDVGLLNIIPAFRHRDRAESVHVKGIEENNGAEQIEQPKNSLSAGLKGLFKKKKVIGDQNDEENSSTIKEKATAEPEPEIKIRNVPDSVSAKGPALQVKDMDYEAPSLDLLDSTMGRPTAGDIKANVKKIRRTLENFGIPVEMGDVSIGPTVTQYTFKPSEGIKLSTITALQNDLALALAAHPVRIEAPIPGKSLVGLEVPNVSVALVRLREILASQPFQKSKDPLTISLGRDVAGNPVVANLAKMPHMLIAGATGSGKSVAINSVLMSLLFRNSPQDLKLILVDPKRVELTNYNAIPHLITPVITEVKKTIHALRWAVAEMDKRYELLNASGKRNITSYNQSSQGQKMPFIVIIIDELADLMAVAANDVEAAIVRLAQMARAVGIHLVVATQRPSVDVITGLIKANITSRVAFNVASSIDSRTIIDHAGAEKLLGNGDMLFISANLSKPRRIQGAFVAEKEVEKVTTFLRKAGEPDYVESVAQEQTATNIPGQTASSDGEGDPLLEEAKQVIIQSQKASASLLQRRLSVGYARAARLLDLMEEKGWIGPGMGAKPREIFIGKNGQVESDDFNPPNTDEPPPPPNDPDAPPPPSEDFRV